MRKRTCEPTLVTVAGPPLPVMLSVNWSAGAKRPFGNALDRRSIGSLVLVKVQVKPTLAAISAPVIV